MLDFTFKKISSNIKTFNAYNAYIGVNIWLI